MFEPKLKSSVWIQAQVRICDQNFMPAMVRRKGDPDAGMIILVLDRLDGTADVYTQARDLDGRLGWLRGVGDGAVENGDVETYIQSQLKFDPDIWVLDIEDPNGQYELDGGLVA